MLNKAGHKIPFIENQTVSGGSGDQYFFRLNDALSYIQDVLGQPDVYINTPMRYFDPPSAPGLFIMKFPGTNFTGHATIWNGAGTVVGTAIAGYEIYFWELPCFIPLGREES